MIKLSQKDLKEKSDYFYSYMGAKKNNASLSEVDPNANVNNKNIATLGAEYHKDINVQVNRYILGERIGKLFGEEVKDEYYRQLSEYEVYSHDESTSGIRPYCVAIDLYPFINEGNISIGGSSKAPKHLASFCGVYVNLIFLIASQFAGAIADVSFLNYFDYFARKDYGDDYLVTHKKEIKNYFQQVIYTLNDPSVGRGNQAVFYNTSVFDKYYFESLFGKTVFPDFTNPDWESVNKLQKFFMNWFNQERTKAILTFPVVTAAGLLDENGIFKDEDFKHFITKEMSEGNSFFIYSSNTPDSLASCCFSKDQKTLTRSSNGINFMSFEELRDSKYTDTKKNLTIFHNGNWVKGKQVELPNRDIYKVTTVNNKELFVTDNHLNVTTRGDIETTKLTTEDYLMFSSRELDAIPERDEKLTFSQGFVIGAFLGNGSFGGECKNGTIYDTNFSMNSNSYETLMTHIDKASDKKSCLSAVYNNVYPVRVSDKDLVAFIQRWTNWKRGTYSYNKELNMDVLQQSLEFRKGILEGWYHTDGGNSNRCYTTSQKLAEQMEVLITSLGMQSIIDVSDRTDEPVIIRGESFKKNYPLYCVRWYAPKAKRSMGGVYKIINNSIYFKIRKIEKVEYDDNVFCFEMENEDEPYFTLPNGVITHNCRLRNEIKDTNSFAYTLGGTGIATGSKKVFTINVNRMVQMGHDIRDEVRKLHKYLIAFNEVLYEEQEHGMLPVYDAGYISLDKQYLTIGVNGVVEAAEFLGFEISDNEEYKTWLKGLLKAIKEENALASEEYTKKFGKKIMFNTEFVPAESLGPRFAKKDKESGLQVNRDCYNSYFYKVEDDSLDIFDKGNLYSKDILDNLDGGSAYHINLAENPTYEVWSKIVDYMTKVGCNYFCWNVMCTCCEDESCGYINKNTLSRCTRCGGDNVSHATRVIGYLKKISSFSEPRQKEAGLRKYHTS